MRDGCFYSFRIRIFWMLLGLADRLANYGFCCGNKAFLKAFLRLSNGVDLLAKAIAPAAYMRAEYAFCSGVSDPIHFEPGARRNIVK